jgi:hypothetical protein
VEGAGGADGQGRRLRAAAARVGHAVGLDARDDDGRPRGGRRDRRGGGRHVRRRGSRPHAWRPDACRHLEPRRLLELWDGDPENHTGRDHRRWAFESAGLDLALRQNERGLGQALGRSELPVRFVVSTRSAPERWLEVAPELEFKLDAEKDWDRLLLRGLRALDRVRVVDLKAYYRGTSVDLAPDPELYRAVVEELPDVIVEDAWLEDGLREALAGAEDRLSFDAPVHSLADLDALPLEPRWLNIKPSRFGTVRGLLETIEACEERGIRLYGGGQYELGPGRLQIQRLASVFYPEGPNDVAPSAYNEGEPRGGLPLSPLPAPEGPGLS